MNAAAVEPDTLVLSSFMTSPVLTMRASASAFEALDLMRKRNIAHLVIVDDHERVVGVVSDGDLRSAQPSTLLVPDATTRGKALSMLRVKDVMSAHPFTARSDWSAVRLLEIMRDTRVGSVPVVDGAGHAVGLVTGLDVVRLALRLLAP